MENKKKLLSVFLCGAMALSMVGCGNTDESEKKTTTKEETTTTTTVATTKQEEGTTTVAATTTAPETTDEITTTTDVETETTTTTTLSETETTTTPKETTVTTTTPKKATTVTTTKAPVTTTKKTTTKATTTTKKVTTTTKPVTTTTVTTVEPAITLDDYIGFYLPQRFFDSPSDYDNSNLTDGRSRRISDLMNVTVVDNKLCIQFYDGKLYVANKTCEINGGSGGLIETTKSDDNKYTFDFREDICVIEFTSDNSFVLYTYSTENELLGFTTYTDDGYSYFFDT